MPFPVSLESPVAPPGAVQEGVVLAPVPEVVAAIAAGRPVLVLDDADRENEADLVCAAANMVEATMALMIREGSGIVCLCLSLFKAFSWSPQGSKKPQSRRAPQAMLAAWATGSMKRL